MGDAITLRADLANPLIGRDERLARRAAGGDERAFATIFERYHQDLYRYCHSILRNPEDAQDALQSTMASALRALPGEQREIALRPWLFRVAHNHAISIARARGRITAEDGIEAVADPRCTDAPEARLRLRQLLADLAALPDGGRAALTMRELSGLSYEEIAAALEISPQAARQKVYEARVALVELEEGREMQCDAVRERVSAGDRRGLRARRIRAHLRACAGCRDFQTAIDRRSSDLAVLCPPLPALAATAILQSVLGGGAAAGVGLAGAGAGAAGSAAGLAAKGAGASLALKGATTLAAATALGIGAAGYSGVVDLPLIGGGSSAAEQDEGAAGGAPATSREVTTRGHASRSAGPGDAARSDGRGAGGTRDAHGSRGKPGSGKPGAANGQAKPDPGPSANAATPPTGPPAQANPGGESAAVTPSPPATPGADPPVHSEAPATAGQSASPSPAAGSSGSVSGPSANATPQAHEAVVDVGSKAEAGPRSETAE